MNQSDSIQKPAKPKKPFNWFYWIGFSLGLLPGAFMAYWIYSGKVVPSRELSVVLRFFGYYAVVFLMASLACTPLRVLFGWSRPMQLRKTFGLYGFVYVLAHLVVYIGFDQGFGFANFLGYKDEEGRNLYATIFGEAWKFPFQFFGMAAFLLLIPLAVTSTNWAIKKIGGKRWQLLHKLAYVIAILAVIHYFMSIKGNDKTWPLAFAGALAVLLTVRVWKKLSSAKKKSAAVKA